MEDKLEKTLNALGRDTIPQDVSQAADRQLEEFRASVLAEGQRSLWSKIMHARLMKVAAAVAFVAAIVVFVVVLNKTETKAWAIEQTIQALQDVHSIMFKGVYRPDVSSDVDMDATIWALANAKRTGAEKTRAEAWGMTRISDANVGYLWSPNGGHVYVNRPGEYNFRPWFDGRFFDKLRNGSLGAWQISYGKDSDTGQDCAFITCSLPNNKGPKSWWFEIDTRTSLPVKFRQWMNSRWEGKPQLDAGTVQYNPELPADFFDFKVPQGAIEVPGRVEMGLLRQALVSLGTEPGCGIVVDGLGTDDACVKVVTDYYNAVLAGDWDTVRKIRTDAVPVDWSKAYGGSNPIHALIQVGKPRMEKDCPVGVIVPCTLSYQDGTTAEKYLIVSFKVVDGRTFYAIPGTWMPGQ